jgi:D,D-heptose 1,7-bisphosphate phosphatase
MKAVILAGGRGVRLGALTTEVPKPMLAIGDKPLLHHQVDLLVSYNITEIIILVNYLKDSIIEYFGDGSRFNARITYFEEITPLGTTGGIKAIEDQLADDFVVLYGDVYINMDLSRLIRFHHEKKSDCTLVLHPNDHPYDSDLVTLDDNDRIVAFHSKPHKPGKWYHNLVNAGAYVLSPKINKFIEKNVKADFGSHVFPSVIYQLHMFGYQTSEYLKDMGTPDRLKKVQDDLESGRIERSHYRHRQPAFFLDRDGVINTERSYISKPEELEVYDFVPAAIRKINRAGYISVVVTNQSAIARNLCTEEDIRTIHKKLESVLGEKNAWLDAIYYCPHHPDKGFPEENPLYKVDCDCRKPKTGMFRKAIEKFNIDPSVSYMIGDSERDIQAGINAGCTTVGVRTGYGIRKSRVSPDYMFSNLAEAVDFIVDDPYKKSFRKVYEHIAGHAGKSPCVILIGGNTRSGKSTLASYLRISFERLGYKILQVALDNWLLPEEQRTPRMNVYDRFQVKTMEQELNAILDGQKITVTSYAHHSERKTLPVVYDPSGIDIIIIEGVVALSSPLICQKAMVKIFTTVDPKVFNQRIEDYYGWRGKIPEETHEIVKKRQVDEYQLIEKESKLADLIINSYGS